MCEPILVTLLKMRPHDNQSSLKNATTYSATSSFAFYKEVPPQEIDALKKCCLVWDSHSCSRCTETLNIWINIWSLSVENFSTKTILWESHSREVKETLNNCLLGTNNFLHPATTAQKEKLLCLSCLHYQRWRKDEQVGKTARGGLEIRREGERKLNFPYIDAVITKEKERKSSTIEGGLFYDLHFLVVFLVYEIFAGSTRIRLTLKDNI